MLTLICAAKFASSWHLGPKLFCAEAVVLRQGPSRKAALTASPFGPGGPLIPEGPPSPCGDTTKIAFQATVTATVHIQQRDAKFRPAPPWVRSPRWLLSAQSPPRYFFCFVFKKKSVSMFAKHGHFFSKIKYITCTESNIWAADKSIQLRPQHMNSRKIAV